MELATEEEEEEEEEALAREINEAVRGLSPWVGLVRGFAGIEVMGNLMNRRAEEGETEKESLGDELKLGF